MRAVRTTRHVRHRGHFSVFSETATSGSGGVVANVISFPQVSIPDTSTVGTAVGTATLLGPHTGVATWSLTNSAGGQFAINSGTGAVTVAGVLSDGVQFITIHVTGLTPTYPNLTVGILVTNPAAQSEPFPVIF